MKQINAQSFRTLRKSRKLSQQWVASKCKCSISLISKWEKGAHLPSGEIMRRIACTALEIEELPIPSLKYCWKCQTQKQLSSFGRDNSRPSKLQSKCLVCNNEVTNAWRKTNKTKFNDYNKTRYKINKKKSHRRRLAQVCKGGTFLLTKSDGSKEWVTQNKKEVIDILRQGELNGARQRRQKQMKEKHERI